MATARWCGGDLPGGDGRDGSDGRDGWLGCVVAPNPGPLTLDGTNTWLVGAPGSGRVAVVDPGPADPAHLDAVLAAVRRRRSTVTVVLLTHGHADHVEGAARFAAAAGCPVRAADPDLCAGAGPLRDGAVLAAGGTRLRVLATPGHTADSVSLWVPGAAAVLAGDTVLGTGTTVIAHPDGALGPYLSSLRRLRRLAARRGARWLLPGHGPARSDVVALLDGYLAHRAERLAQVRAALGAGARTPQEVVARVYADVDRKLWPAAERSVAAQLAYLAAGG